MHLFITLTSDNELEIPITYNHVLQGVIYNRIEPNLATFLHEEGYKSNKRKFKLFTFSRIMGPFQFIKEKNTIKFPKDVELIISSPIDKFCQSIANGLLTQNQINFGSTRATVKKIMFQKYEINDEKVVLRTLSPIVVYSTFKRFNDRKYTCYFQPGEPEYNLLIENNLRKKYQAYYGKDAPAGEVKVKKVSRMKLEVVNYKNIIIKGYSGKVAVTGPRELLQIAVDSGLGSKNSQGFGCVTIEQRRWENEE